MSSQAQSINECICYLVRRTARTVTNAYDKALSSTGLRVTQFGLLGAIFQNSVASVSQLGELLGLDQTTVTRNLMLLEESGLVERVAHHDPRVKLLKLTSKGKQKVQKAYLCWREIQEQIRSPISEQEWRQFKETLRTIENLSLG
jgi:DNA-binding MarR family transcriptional regulator